MRCKYPRFCYTTRVKVYQAKTKKLSGTDFHEVYSHALKLFKSLKKKSKRRPYVRSAFFKKDKVFLDYFWGHLWQKKWQDRFRRLKFYACSLDLIQHSHVEQVSKENPNKRSEILHRFAGSSAEKELFFVQISEDKKTGNKNFLSVFPVQ